MPDGARDFGKANYQTLRDVFDLEAQNVAGSIPIQHWYHKNKIPGGNYPLPCSISLLVGAWGLQLTEGKWEMMGRAWEEQAGLLTKV